MTKLYLHKRLEVVCKAVTECVRLYNKYDDKGENNTVHFPLFRSLYSFKTVKSFMRVSHHYPGLKKREKKSKKKKSQRVNLKKPNMRLKDLPRENAQHSPKMTQPSHACGVSVAAANWLRKFLRTYNRSLQMLDWRAKKKKTSWSQSAFCLPLLTW